MEPVLVDLETVEYTLEEQIALWSRAFLALPTFEFLVGVSTREGMLPTSLTRLTIRNVDRGSFVNEPLTRTVRSLLMQRDGTKVTDLLAEISNRGGSQPAPGSAGNGSPRLPARERPALARAATAAGDQTASAKQPVARRQTSSGRQRIGRDT
jgi:hypothetical protein